MEYWQEGEGSVSQDEGFEAAKAVWEEQNRLLRETDAETERGAEGTPNQNALQQVLASRTILVCGMIDEAQAQHPMSGICVLLRSCLLCVSSMLACSGYSRMSRVCLTCFCGIFIGAGR